MGEVSKMGRGKQRRKYKQKKKRMEKAKRGKLVRFDLQNSGRKYSGFRDKYCYQTNIHRLIYSNRQIIMRSDIKLPQLFASWSNSL